MKRITVTLTEQQAWTVANIFDDSQWVQNPDSTKAENAFYQRIADQVRKCIYRSKSGRLVK